LLRVPVVLDIVKSRAGPPDNAAMRCAGDSSTGPHTNLA
jgi:hypothetical protein